MSNSSELLSAESLMFGVLGVVFGVWYPEMSGASGADIPIHKEDRGPVSDRVRRVFWSKAVPLAVSSTLVFLIFAPNAVMLIAKSIVHIKDHGLSEISNYDTVGVAFVAVSLLNLALSTFNVSQVIGLHRVRRRITE